MTKQSSVSEKISKSFSGEGKNPLPFNACDMQGRQIPAEREVKAIKHRIVINASDRDGNKTNVLKGADVKLPARLLRFLFGDFTQVYLLSPGQTVESVDIREIGKEGPKHVKDERTEQGASETEEMR